MTGPRDGFDGIRATYRLQFHREFTFRDAEALVPYLSDLGISHLYASPIMEARPGSTHGYDIVDHNRLNPEIGTDEDFAALVAALKSRGMGLVLDFVPNHMGIGGDNAWWIDVLTWGEDSPYAEYFDINWDAARADLKGKVLLPVLGDQYGVVLEKGEIALKFEPERGCFSAHYYDHRFPISPRSYAMILEAAGPALAELARSFTVLEALPAAQRREQASALERSLAEQAVDPAVGDAIAAAVQAFAGEAERPATFDRLHRLLDEQPYRLAYWRVAAEEINYRRFFNINDLAGLRIELPQLFAETHRLAFRMVERGDIDGLRIDHIDGLFDPSGYCTALQENVAKPLFVLVEKILARYEGLPDWPIAGSTGYDFVNQVLGLFVDPAGEVPMTRLYRRIADRADDFDAVLYICKKRIMQVNLASEMNVLARRFHRLSVSEWRTRDFTLSAMLAALEEVIAAFPIYRTYVSERGASPDDERFIEWAVAQAKKRWRTGDKTILDFIHRVLLAKAPGHSRPADVLRTAMQFQQITGPVMAKSFEDTAFYRYFRLLALNEVGGDPRRFGISVSAFHHMMQDRARNWPRAMVTTATHDTKRGEDGRIRLALLSEMPREWGRRVTLWLRLNRRHRSEIDGEVVPDRNVEYLFYQTLLGAWSPGLSPSDGPAIENLRERVDAYLVKAVREGKEQSSWSNPDADYEAALKRFVARVLDPSRSNPFLADFDGFVRSVGEQSAIASLSQIVVKLMVPGVPDTYQGGELWDFSLVDPDNRRPVDWDLRRRMLGELKGATAADLDGDWQSGRDKLFVTSRLLDLRRGNPELFAAGEYLPLDVEGSGSDRLVAFARRKSEMLLVAIVPRLVHAVYGDARTVDRGLADRGLADRGLADRGLADRGSADWGSADWGSAEILLPQAPGWRDVFTGRRLSGERISAAAVFGAFPVAVLIADGRTAA